MAGSKEERHIEHDNREWELEKKKEWMRDAKCWNVLEWGRKRKKRRGDRDKDNVCGGEKEEEEKKTYGWNEMRERRNNINNKKY